MKKIHEMTAQELRDELKRTEQSLHSVFEEIKRNFDPALSDAYFEFQNVENRIRNRLSEMEVNA